jgi:protein-disulfide isomerase
MNEKALSEAALDRHLASAGLDPSAVRKAAIDPQIDRQILDTRALANALRIDGTPAFIIGDTIIPGADIAALRAAITQAKAGTLKKLS